MCDIFWTPPETFHVRWVAFDNQVFQDKLATRSHGMWWSHSLGRMLGEGVEVFESREDAIKAARAQTEKQIRQLMEKLERLV